jgi:hypothetical protein
MTQPRTGPAQGVEFNRQVAELLQEAVLLTCMLRPGTRYVMVTSSLLAFGSFSRPKSCRRYNVFSAPMVRIPSLGACQRSPNLWG